MKKMILLAVLISVLSGCAGYNSFLWDVTHPQSVEEWDDETGGTGGGEPRVPLALSPSIQDAVGRFITDFRYIDEEISETGAAVIDEYNAAWHSYCDLEAIYEGLQ